MPRLRQLASGLGQASSDVLMTLLQNQLIGGRQQELAELQNQLLTTRRNDERENMTLQSVLSNLLTQKGKLAEDVMGGTKTPEQAGEASNLLLADLPEFLRSRLSSSADFGPLAPSRAARLAPIGEDIDKASAPTAVPTREGIRRRALAKNITPTQDLPYKMGEERIPSGVTVDQPDIAGLIAEAGSKRADLTKHLTRESVPDIDEQGNEVNRFLTEPEQMGLTTRRSRTPEQGASFAARTARAENTEGLPELRGEAERRQSLAGPLSPQVTGAKARQEGAVSGAQRRAQLQAELNTMGITGQQQTAALTLADDYEKASQEFFVVDGSFKRIATLAKIPETGEGRAMGDIGMVFAIMKMYDPPSTVREGEQAQAANAAGVPERIRTMYNRLLQGDRLGATQRNGIVAVARDLYSTKARDQKKVIQDFTGRAQQLRVPPALVVREPVTAEPSALDVLRGRTP